MLSTWERISVIRCAAMSDRCGCCARTVAKVLFQKSCDCGISNLKILESRNAMTFSFESDDGRGAARKIQHANQTASIVIVHAFVFGAMDNQHGRLEIIYAVNRRDARDIVRMRDGVTDVFLENFASCCTVCRVAGCERKRPIGGP